MAIGDKGIGLHPAQTGGGGSTVSQVIYWIDYAGVFLAIPS